MVIIWFRADLRTIDQPALNAAVSFAQLNHLPLRAVYFTTPEQWHLHDMGAVRVDFEYRSVCALQADLAGLNINLDIVPAHCFAEIPEKLLAYVNAHQVQAVFANRQYEWNEVLRDRAVHRLLRASGVTIEWTHDQTLLPPDAIKTGQGNFYAVFTPYKKAVLAQLTHAMPIPLQPEPEPMPVRNYATQQLFDASLFFQQQFGYVQTPHTHAEWPAGTEQGLLRLTEFCDDDLADYARCRDFPAKRKTSGLSPYLVVGAISVRQCWHASENARYQHQLRHDDVLAWQNELIWRDFYRHVMVGFPQLGQSLPYKRSSLTIQWRNDTQDFAAWCAGQTGFPLVDAAMRCLNATGFMHNRLRMVVSMFLVKDLLIDWRWGERYFAQKLIDFDFPSNNGGWQWSASTGMDSVPYFRIFNPTTQSERFDPQGEFIRAWIPELQGVSAPAIHAPTPIDAPDYVRPIVDHSWARMQTIAAYKSAL